MAESWEKAKKKAKLTDTEVEMAKRLNLTPEAVISLIPDKRELWKDPVALFVRRLYEKKFGSPVK